MTSDQDRASGVREPGGMTGQGGAEGALSQGEPDGLKDRGGDTRTLELGNVNEIGKFSGIASVNQSIKSSSKVTNKSPGSMFPLHAEV